jgi:hypothetical protein
MGNIHWLAVMMFCDTYTEPAACRICKCNE